MKNVLIGVFVVGLLVLASLGCKNNCPPHITRGVDGRWHISNSCD